MSFLVTFPVLNLSCLLFSFFGAICIFSLLLFPALLFLLSFLAEIHTVTTAGWLLYPQATTSKPSVNSVFDWVRPLCGGGPERCATLAAQSVGALDYERFGPGLRALQTMRVGSLVVDLSKCG